jgi:CheY-like chemotaxis protein
LSERKVTILCVDDQELPLTLRKLVLEKQGYAVLTAISATDALGQLDAFDVDLVLTDQLMPGGTGLELARRVKAARPGIPVVLISGVNELPPDADEADLFLSKVEGPAIMCEKIAAVLAGQKVSPGTPGQFRRTGSNGK